MQRLSRPDAPSGADGEWTLLPWLQSPAAPVSRRAAYDGPPPSVIAAEIVSPITTCGAHKAQRRFQYAWRFRWATTTAFVSALIAASCVECAHGAPKLKVWRALSLAGEPRNENLATLNQAMNAWSNAALANGSENELVVALIHQFNNLDRRADDRQYAVVWKSDGKELTELHRVPMSCPDVELVVPSRGPYAYEARLDLQPSSLHPECSCQEGPGRPCPAGVLAGELDSSGHVTTWWNITSPIESHFVSLENEWRELIADPGLLGRLKVSFEALVVPVTEPVLNRTGLAGNSDPSLACPGSYDELIGAHDVTIKQLVAQGMKLPENHVRGRWCLVRRGHCSETAKVKVCELSGAVGTIIVDHGNYENDQEILIRYSRAAREAAYRPVLFVSKIEGEALIQAATTGHGVKVKVGPDVPGPPPQGYTVGSGLVVHRMVNFSNGRNVSAEAKQKRYPNLFATAGWVEVSDVRDIMFVCIPANKEIRIFDVSKPLLDIPLVGVINRQCARSGRHDYRVLDYYHAADGFFYTLLIDPANAGNRLYYYNTDNLSSPTLRYELHANWEAENDGLGQVRPGGNNGKYHIVSWHCSNLYCGKSHGDSLYILNTEALLSVAHQVQLPMLSPGAFVRDLACGEDGVCLVSMTWDGLIALDSGARDTQNLFGVIDEYIGNDPFSSANIPYHMVHLRMYSGAQKVYRSAVYPRKFYVEHADFSLRPLQIGDSIRALQLREVYIAEVEDYDPTVKLAGFAGVAPPASQRATSVEFSMTVQGVDHARLSAAPAVMDSFKVAIQRAVAMETRTQVLPEHVTLVLAVGSVVVYVTIAPPESISASQVQSILFGSLSTLASSVAAQVSQVPGISVATLGNIFVTGVTNPVLQVSDLSDDQDMEGSNVYMRGDPSSDDADGSEISMSTAVVLLVFLGITLILVTVFTALLIKSWRANQQQQEEIIHLRQAHHGPSEGDGVVVGRPVVAAGETGDADTDNLGVATGRPLQQPTIVSAPSGKAWMS